MMRIKTYGYLFAALLMVGSNAAYAQEESPYEGAKICYSYEGEMGQRKRADGDCFEGATKNASGKCVIKKTFDNYFAFIINDDNTMDFGFSYWFPSGSNCTVTGIAEETETGWRYVKETDKAYEKCEIDITMDDTQITLNSREGAHCKSKCGVGAAILDLEFPLSYIASKEVWPVDVAPEGVVKQRCE